MASRYIISNYKRAEDTEPRISFRNDDLTEAEAKFTIYEERKFRSVVLYDTKTENVLKSASNGKPIYLVKAYKKARGDKYTLSKIARKAAVIGIEQMVEKMGGRSVPGLVEACFEMCEFPYYAGKGDVPAATGAVAHLFGSLFRLFGAQFGDYIAGRTGAFIGGLIGEAAADILASAIVDFLMPESQKCTACEGKGLVQEYRCTHCDGKGYLW